MSVLAVLDPSFLVVPPNMGFVRIIEELPLGFDEIRILGFGDLFALIDVPAPPQAELMRCRPGNVSLLPRSTPGPFRNIDIAPLTA